MIWIYDKNHGVPNEPIAKKIQKNMSTTEFEPNLRAKSSIDFKSVTFAT